MRTHIGSCWLAFIMWRGAAASIEAQEPRIGPRCLPLFSEIVVVVVVVTTAAATTTTNPCRIFLMRGGGWGEKRHVRAASSQAAGPHGGCVGWCLLRRLESGARWFIQ